MKQPVIKIALLFFLLFFTEITIAQNVRQKINFDDNWKFHLGNASDATKNFNYGGQSSVDLKLADDPRQLKDYNAVLNAGFDDKDWETINLPHDWAVGLPFVKQSLSYQGGHGYKPIGVPYPENSIGWYRKSFTLSASDSVNNYVLQFDGVYRDCKVFVNGNYVCAHKSGYNGFAVDITNYLFYGKSNEIVVEVNASKFEGWWYEGAGIYRHVWLNQVNPIHIATNGMDVRATIKDNHANLQIETTIENKKYHPTECQIESYLADDKGVKVSESVSTPLNLDHGNKTAMQNINVSQPHLWSIDDPYLYKVVSLVKQQEKTIDSLTVDFGFRTVLVTADGLFVNGKYVKIKGFCNHQDHAGIGTAVPDAIQYYRLKLLKDMGANAIRIHHEQSPVILDMCDKLGILVLDETRYFSTSDDAMEEWEQQIIQDRNHPSIFMWCLGNEQNVFQNTEQGKRIALALMAKQQELDPTRTITYGGNNGGKKRIGINEVIPVRGFNYYIEESFQYKRDNPDQPIIGTETASAEATRGVYFPTKEDNYQADYDNACEDWWKIAADNKWFIGGFSWSGFDYRGENDWPSVVCNYGIMDLCGFPKNTYYYYKSWWTNEDVLHLYPHWNWQGKEGQNIKVWCNSNADRVELFLNGKSQGIKDMPRNGHLEWMVKYHPGTLKAIAYKQRRKFETTIKTTGSPYQIVAAPNKTIITADGKDAIVINYSVTDKKGVEVPDAMNLLKFKLKGDAKIIGVGNGDPNSLEPDKCPAEEYKRHLFNGKCQVIIQSGNTPGNIEIQATGENLKAASTTIESK